MNHEQHKSKIRWRCRRGMLELDLILGRFLETHLDSMTSEEMTKFEAVLTSTDPDLYAWCMGYESPTNKEFVDVIRLIRAVSSPE
jgi:antitoxin CptB